MSHGNEMICQPMTLSGDAEWPKVADAVIEAQKCALGALEDYLKNYCNHSAYKLGTEFTHDKDFRDARAKFAEENHQKTFPCLPKWEDPTLWLSFPYAFG